MLWHSCVYFFQWTMRWKILASSYGNLRLCTNAFKWVMAFWFPLDPYVPVLYVMFVVVTFSISVCVILKKGFILFLYAFFSMVMVGEGKWMERRKENIEKNRNEDKEPPPLPPYTHIHAHTRAYTHTNTHTYITRTPTNAGKKWRRNLFNMLSLTRDV